MRLSILALAATLTLGFAATQPALAANAGANKMKACGAQWSAMAPAQKQGMTYQQFTSKCMSGKAVATAPMSGPMTGPMTPQQKLSACAANWQKAKTAHTTGGLSYQQYTAKCTKKS